MEWGKTGTTKLQPLVVLQKQLVRIIRGES